MKKHVKILIAVLLFAACILIPPVTHAEEYIKAFDALITINQDSSVSIEESIVYFTDEPKHGIFRYIPYLLRRDEDVKITRISDVSIIDEFNNPIPFTQSTSNEFTEFKIGDPHITFEGDKTYVIRYKVNQALERFSEHDELYWDITGEGWEFPIQASRARIHSPFALIERVDCFSGAVGSNNAACDSKIENDNNATFTYDQTIEYGENVTIAVSLKRPNQLLFPKISSSIAIAWINRIAYALASLPVIIMFLLWYTFGRDYVSQSPNVFNSDNSQPQRKKGVFERFRVPFVYEPLSISPGEAGVMLDEKADANDVIAEIVELARKKYLSIDFLAYDNVDKVLSDYTLKKLRPADDNLTRPQAYLLKHLFKSKNEVTLTSLKGNFFTHFEETKKLLVSSLQQEKLFFTRNPRASKAFGIIFAVILNVFVVWILSKLLQNNDISLRTIPLAIYFYIGYFKLKQLFMRSPKKNILLSVMIIILLAMLLFWLIVVFVVFKPIENAWTFLLLVIGFPLCVQLGINLAQKSAQGTNAMLQAKGLKETLRLAKWRDEIKEKNLFIEAIIPYSIALGVIDKLSKDMDDLGIKPPEYVSRGFTRGTTLNTFTNGFSSSATSSLAYNPSSSSRSSGSGFSGGSSGGGGGGGGGGSW